MLATGKLIPRRDITKVRVFPFAKMTIFDKIFSGQNIWYTIFRNGTSFFELSISDFLFFKSKSKKFQFLKINGTP